MFDRLGRTAKRVTGLLFPHSVYRGHHHGDISVARDLEFHGLVHGSVTVEPGRQLYLHGRIAGDLIVEKDALAAVHGCIRGAVLNRGAHVLVVGSVGSVRDTGRGRTTVNHRAAVKRINALASGSRPDGYGQLTAPSPDRADPVLAGDGSRSRAGWKSWITD